MPKIVDAVPESVFYLFRTNPRTGKIEGPYGTGFLVLRAAEHLQGKPHAYAVTNWHVAIKAGASIIRLNTADGNSRFIERDPSEWNSPKNGDDLAVLDVTEAIDPTTDQIIGLYEDIFIDPEVIAGFSIGIGEDEFMCGLFASHSGGERNVPVVRFCNLSMMATEAAPVELETGAYRSCFLMDTRSRSDLAPANVQSSE